MDNSVITAAILEDIRIRASGARSTQEMLPLMMQGLEQAEIDPYAVPLEDWKRMVVVAVRALRQGHPPRLPNLAEAHLSACNLHAER